MKYGKKTTLGIYKRILGSMSGLAEINVELQPDSVPYFDPTKNKIVMPEAISYAENEEEDFQISKGIMVHESGHVMFAPRIQEELKRLEINNTDPKHFAEWFNVFVDVNNEYKVSEIFPNLKTPLGNKTDLLFQKKPELLKSDNPFLQVLMRTDQLANLKPEFPEGMDENLIKFVKLTVKEYLKNKLFKAKGTEVVKFTKKTFNRWKKLCDTHKEYQESISNSGELNKLMKQLGKAIAAGDDAKAAKIQKQIDELVKKSKQELFKDGVNEILVNGNLPGEGKFSETELKQLRKLIEQQIIKETGDGSLGADCETEQITKLRPPKDNTPSYDADRAYKNGCRMGKVLNKRVQLQKDFQQRHKSGKIDLAEVRKQINKAGRIINQQIFKRKEDYSRGGEWAVEVLIDCSGSMRGRLLNNAKEALATLNYALKGLPNVHYALTGFDSHDTVNEWQIKRFNERKLNRDYLDGLRAYGGTPTHTAVLECGKRLLKFNCKKIMVVITDGEPARVELTQEYVKKCEKYNIGVIGVGLPGVNEEIMKQIFNQYYFFTPADIVKGLSNMILSHLKPETNNNLTKPWYVSGGN